MSIVPTIQCIDQTKQDGTGSNHFLHVVSSFSSPIYEQDSHDPILWTPTDGKFLITLRVKESSQLPNGMCYAASNPVTHSIFLGTTIPFNSNSVTEYLRIVIRDESGVEVGAGELHKNGIVSQDEPTEDSKPIAEANLPC